MDLKIDEAIQELQDKPDAMIEFETAVKWAARAAAAYVLSHQSLSNSDKVSWLLRAEDLRHEALEHGALVGDQGAVLSELQKEIDQYRDEAIKAITL